MVLCDATWADPDENASNGIDVRAQLDFLRLDSMIMMVQISIRQILQARALSPRPRVVPLAEARLPRSVLHADSLERPGLAFAFNGETRKL